VRIGVISDTHLPACNETLRKIVDRYFLDADLIVHAGDLVNLDVLEAFGSKPFQAVCGNMDPASVRRMLPDRFILEIQGFRLGVMHGWGSAGHLEEKILALLGPVECVIYGHTHYPANWRRNGVLFFNPGSALDKRFATDTTVGIRDVGDTITGQILKIEIEKEP